MPRWHGNVHWPRNAGWLSPGTERANQSALAARKPRTRLAPLRLPRWSWKENRNLCCPGDRTTADTAVHKPTGIDVPSQNADTVAGNDEINNEPTIFTANPCKGRQQDFFRPANEELQPLHMIPRGQTGPGTSPGHITDMLR
jgi:hypothetical protein